MTERRDADQQTPVEQSKDDPPTRPDRPTPSDEATLAQRGEGTHAEFADAPTSMRDASERDASAHHRRASGDAEQESTDRPADEA